MSTLFIPTNPTKISFTSNCTLTFSRLTYFSFIMRLTLKPQEIYQSHVSFCSFVHLLLCFLCSVSKQEGLYELRCVSHMITGRLWLFLTVVWIANTSDNMTLSHRLLTKQSHIYRDMLQHPEVIKKKTKPNQNKTDACTVETSCSVMF